MSWRPASDVGEARIALHVSPDDPRSTGVRISIVVDYDGCLPPGVSGTISVSIRGPDGFVAFSEEYDEPPETVSFLPSDSGEYLVTVRELTHNRWWGSLQLSVTTS